MSEYDYQELRAKAMETRDQKDIDALGEWMERFGMDAVCEKLITACEDSRKGVRL